MGSVSSRHFYYEVKLVSVSRLYLVHVNGVYNFIFIYNT
jgi:hypothetical protein